MENKYRYRYTVICPSTEGHGVSGNERKGREASVQGWWKEL